MYIKKIITILGIWSIILCGMKAYQINEQVVEVNYIGDLERENQESVQNNNSNENLETNNTEYEEENQNEETEGFHDIGENIRVIITTEDFQSYIHESVILSAPSGLKVSYEDDTNTQLEVQSFCIDGMKEENIRIWVEAVKPEEKIEIESLNRAYGTPQYYGAVELFVEESGIVIVNELSLELYLRGVLPSEMPASYEMEALKAQAVCARSYAYKHMELYNYPEYLAHVDDSTSYQVYNNCEETEVTNIAILETEYEKATYNGEVVMTYFFSTSSGYTTDIEAWGTNAEADEYDYLTSVRVWDGNQEYESQLSWFQWSVSLTELQMLELLEENLKDEIGELKSIAVTRYGAGGVALALEITGTKYVTTIESEYAIRKALGSTRYTMERKNGSSINGSVLLPSAFFEITKVNDGYEISGGGYGHGVGMSQNGANEMAKSGMSYIEILQFFYQGIEVSA